MGIMKDYDRRIRQGGDDAIAAVSEYVAAMTPPMPDDEPYAAFVYNHDGREYVERKDYERLRAMLRSIRATLDGTT